MIKEMNLKLNLMKNGWRIKIIIQWSRKETNLELNLIKDSIKIII